MTQQINLYEMRLRPRHELATARNVGLSTLMLLVMMIALSSYARHGATQKSVELAALQDNVRGAQERMNTLSKEVSARRVSPVLLAEQSLLRSLLSTQQEVLDVLDSGRLGNTSGFSNFMLGFARQAQPDLWLTGFSVSAGGEEIEIRGRLLDPAKLPAYVQRLSAEPIFHGRRFATLDMQSVDAEAAKPETTKVAQATPVAAALPRHVEFVLRSAAGASSATPGKPGGEKP